jgi:hypothetical protein
MSFARLHRGGLGYDDELVLWLRPVYAMTWVVTSPPENETALLIGGRGVGLPGVGIAALICCGAVLGAGHALL